MSEEGGQQKSNATLMDDIFEVDYNKELRIYELEMKRIQRNSR